MLPQELMREVRRLQVRTRRRVEGLFAGDYHTAFKGRGIEFADVREYEPGDDVRAIDWNVTARAGRPFIKRFVEERELTVTLAVDLSASGDFASGTGATARSKRRIAIETAAILAFAAASNNDRTGLCLFTDEVEFFLPPAKGRVHSLRLLRELLDFSPRSRGTDVAGAAMHLGRMLRGRGIVFLISDFIGVDGPASPVARPRPSLETALRLLARRHEVIAVQVSDPRESRLPDVGLAQVIDPETGLLRWIDTSSRTFRQRFEADASARQIAVESSLAAAEIERINLSTDRPFVPELAKALRLREGRRS
ncbi:MAG: DUF58 domain-containing protein [Phycisphaerae bacterium]|jgi:uncharacterized protein (DUF58 family)